MKKPSLLVIFLTVFLDLVGFGIVLPLLPVYSENFGASGFLVGVIMASFSAMQFLFAPMWGRWSDKVGRRPVLLISNFGSSVSYALFGLASGLEGNAALWTLLASRIFAGICGANISVAQAYIADITPPEDRSRRMGLIGMAFGLGFILGPALGALSLSGFGRTGPGWVAAAMCFGNFLLTCAILPESRQPSSEHAPERPRLSLWSHTLGRPQVGLLVWLFFLATFAFTCFETTLGLLVSQTFKLDARKPEDAKAIGYLFAYCGLIGALVQGGAIGRAVKKLGEPKLKVTTDRFMGKASWGISVTNEGKSPAVVTAHADLLDADGLVVAQDILFGEPVGAGQTRELTGMRMIRPDEAAQIASIKVRVSP